VSSTSERSRRRSEDEARITEREQKQIAKLLQDPTYFPVEFRTWLVEFIESSGISITYSQIKGGPGGAARLPAGLILEPAIRGHVPRGTIACDGSLRSREVFRGLFDEIGEEFGDGDGETTFKVPNRPGRVITTGGVR
jgi:hypothetical protein